MCLILFALDAHPLYRLVFAANRDEFYDRPSLAMDHWDAAPGVLAGLDLKGGGTWMGVTRSGRMAAITNYRDPAAVREGAPTRGRLVSDYLTGTAGPESYLRHLHSNGHRYNGFNLIVGDGGDLCYYGNRSDGIQRIQPGIHGLSNRLLDTPWPKVERGKQRLSALLSAGEAPAPEALFELLQDRSVPPDNLLPDTGVGSELERMLSPLFIASPGYGTRCATLVLWEHTGTVDVWERTYVTAAAEPTPEETRHFTFRVAED